MANNNINLKVGVDYTELTGLIKTTDQTKRALNLVSKEFANTNDQKSWMRGVNQIIQAQKQLDVSARMSRSEIMKLAHQMKQATQFNNTLAAATNNLSAATAQMGKRMSRSGVLMQQTGYQVGDFIVQIQSGTNAFVAAGQQLTQMAGTLTLLGGKFIALGTVLGVAIPLFTAAAAALQRTRKEAKGNSKAFDSLSKNIGSLNRVNEALVGENGKVVESFRAVLKVVQEVENKALQQSLREILSAAEAEIRAFERKQKNYARFSQGSIFPTSKPEIDLFGFKDIERVTQVFELLLGIQGESREEIAKSIQATLLYLNGSGLLTDEVKNLVAQYSNAVGVLDVAVQTTDQLTESTVNAANAVATLAENLSVARGEVLDEAVGGNVDFFDPRNESGTAGVVRRERPNPQRNRISAPSGGGGGSAPRDPLASLMERIALDEQLLGVSRERQQVMRAIANSETQYSDAAIEGAIKRLEAYNLEKEKLDEIQGLYDVAQGALEDGFMAMVEGTKSVKDAFKDMARAIIKELYDVYVVQRLVGGFGQDGGSGSGILGLLGGLFGKASGGTVMSNQPYLVGEKGPELIVPRNRGHVMNADLTADALGGGGGVTVVQNFNFQANGDESVKKLIAQAAPSIANMAKQSVMDSRRRGGAMKNAFG